MISNRDSKFIKSLQLKKFRFQEKAFIVEGAKNVLELIQSDFVVTNLYITDHFLAEHEEIIESAGLAFQLVTENQIQKVGSFKTNNAGLAVAKIPEPKELTQITDVVLAFDRLKDPGNMGTIIRIADWYGFDKIVCSPESVDCYNPKVISATMGSFSRVTVFYQDLTEFLDLAPYSYGTTLDGNNLHNVTFKKPSVILFGNESQGIAPELIHQLDEQIKIEGFGAAESLNVAVSTAVICDNFRRMDKGLWD